jgi:hypothetical protein
MDKLQNLPSWVWIAGLGVIAIVVYVFFIRNKNSSASGSPVTTTVPNTDTQSTVDNLTAAVAQTYGATQDILNKLGQIQPDTNFNVGTASTQSGQDPTGGGQSLPTTTTTAGSGGYSGVNPNGPPITRNDNSGTMSHAGQSANPLSAVYIPKISTKWIGDALPKLTKAKPAPPAPPKLGDITVLKITGFNQQTYNQQNR